MIYPWPDDPLHERTLTDGERWELLRRSLDLVNKRGCEHYRTSTGVVVRIYDVDVFRIVHKSGGPPDSSTDALVSRDALMLRRLTPVDAFTLFSVDLPLSPKALRPHHWAHPLALPTALDAMRRHTVLEDMAEL